MVEVFYWASLGAISGGVVWAVVYATLCHLTHDDWKEFD